LDWIFASHEPAARGDKCPIHSAKWNQRRASAFVFSTTELEDTMGRGLLLWLIGIPIPIILLVWLLGGLH
jgi:hypothetical protein